MRVFLYGLEVLEEEAMIVHPHMNPAQCNARM
jgi:hypothetical protein